MVDYFAISQNLKALVNSFEVLDLTKFSDHKPRVCKLNIRGNFLPSEEILGRLADVPKNYKWDNENQSMHFSFLSKQHEPSTTSKLDKLCETPCRIKKMSLPSMIILSASTEKWLTRFYPKNKILITGPRIKSTKSSH